jgi:hypothetical protein
VAVEHAYELAYREAVRALDHQIATLTELRSRAGMLLATASIAVSLLDRESLQGARPFAWLAIVCFALLSVCVLAIAWPHTDLNFGLDPQALLAARLSAETFTLVDLTLELIAHMGRQWRTNAHRLVRAVRFFRIGACLLATQIVLTIMSTSVIV